MYLKYEVQVLSFLVRVINIFTTLEKTIGGKNFIWEIIERFLRNGQNWCNLLVYLNSKNNKMIFFFTRQNDQNDISIKIRIFVIKLTHMLYNTTKT